MLDTGPLGCTGTATRMLFVVYGGQWLLCLRARLAVRPTSSVAVSPVPDTCLIWGESPDPMPKAPVRAAFPSGPELGACEADRCCCGRSE